MTTIEAKRPSKAKPQGLASNALVRPRAGDTWRFPMQSDSGRRVWWTRTITFINDGWAHWDERDDSKRDSTMVIVLMEGSLVSRPNDQTQQLGGGE